MENSMDRKFHGQNSMEFHGIFHERKISMKENPKEKFHGKFHELTERFSPGIHYLGTSCMYPNGCLHNPRQFLTASAS
jgi:hypothetical protein